MAKQRTQHERNTRDAALDVLYEKALPATRSGALYNAFPYPTKISPEATALYIAAHTNPGDVIFDGFAGSGTTGLGALLCENPSEALKASAEELGLTVKWGARKVVLYELGVIGAFIADNLCNPPNPAAFECAAMEILNDTDSSVGWVYDSVDPQGEKGTVRHVIWADRLTCSECGTISNIWDGCVTLNPAKISSIFCCPDCGKTTKCSDLERVTKRKKDAILSSTHVSRDRDQARVYGVTDGKLWSRPASESDDRHYRRIMRANIPESVPVSTIPWGDLYRSGYHTGITHLHHFYTRRNLIVFAELWQRTKNYNGSLRKALQFWLLSYNASHATIMTRVVAKSGQPDVVLTSAQPGVLYVSGLPVEKNLFAGLTRKLKTISAAFSEIYGRSRSVEVHQRSSCNVRLENNSIDYIFTDPPFGGNIPYAEINFINEAWLGKHTNTADEAIVSNHQGKGIADYGHLLTQAFRESSRILKPSSSATVVFHSSTAAVWNCLSDAYGDAGFAVRRASVLDKKQGSFKQVTTNGAVKGDPVLELCKRPKSAEVSGNVSIWDTAKELYEIAARSGDLIEQSPQRLYSRLVNYCLEHHQSVSVDADTFYSWFSEIDLEKANARCDAT